MRPLLLCLCLLAAPATADEAQLARARGIVAGSCFLCHGMQGEAASELYPSSRHRTRRTSPSGSPTSRAASP